MLSCVMVPAFVFGTPLFYIYLYMCRNNSGRERSESRVPNGMGPIEIALRNGLYRKTRIISLSHWWGLLLIRRRKHTSTTTYTHGRSVLGLRRIQKSKATNRKTGFQTMRDLRCLCSVRCRVNPGDFFFLLPQSMVGPSETSVYNFCVLKPCRVPHLGVNIIRKGHDSSRSDDDGSEHKRT